MGTQTQTFRSTAAPSTTQVVYNINSPVTPLQEFSQLLSNGTKQIIIRCRGIATIRMTFTSGETNTKYITIPKNCSYEKNNFNLTNATVYLSCDKSSQVIEIEQWS